MEDFVETLAGRNDELADLAQRVAAAADPDAQYDGVDGSGTVTVTVTGDGRVADVRLDRSWRQALDVDDLGFAVNEAARAAGSARLESWAEALDERLNDPERGATPQTPAFDLSRRLSDAAVQTTAERSRTEHALGEVLSMLESIDQDLDRFSAELRESTRAFTAHSSERHVSATVDDSGGVAGISYDKRWLRNAQDLAIGRETQHALRAAYQLAAEQGIQARLSGSSLDVSRQIQNS